MQEESDNSKNRIIDLRDRIRRLKEKFAENEIKVNQATDAASSADELAKKAENVIYLIIEFVFIITTY